MARFDLGSISQSTKPPVLLIWNLDRAAVDFREGKRDCVVGIIGLGIEGIAASRIRPVRHCTDIAVLAWNWRVHPFTLSPAGIKDLGSVRKSQSRKDLHQIRTSHRSSSTPQFVLEKMTGKSFESTARLKV